MACNRMYHTRMYTIIYSKFIRYMCTFVEDSYDLMVDLIPHLVDNSPLRSPVWYGVVL